MNEQQARFIRKLRVDQHCSYPTVARKFYSEFNDTKHCSKSDAECLMYFNLDNVEEGAQVHRFSDGDFAVKSYKVIEYIFPPEVGKGLCLAAAKFFEEDPSDGWLDFACEDTAVT